MSWRDQCPRSVVQRTDAYLAAIAEAGDWMPDRVEVVQPAPGRDPSVKIIWPAGGEPPDHVKKFALLVTDRAPGAATVKRYQTAAEATIEQAARDRPDRIP